MGQAWAVYDRLMSDTRFVYVEEPQGMEPLWRKFCPLELVAPHLWTDAYLAAFAAAGGLQLVTFDKGFRRFVGVNTLILGQQPAMHEEQPEYQVRS
jgi:predicted nucleic acid-binding protein